MSRSGKSCSYGRLQKLNFFIHNLNWKQIEKYQIILSYIVLMEVFKHWIYQELPNLQLLRVR